MEYVRLSNYIARVNNDNEILTRKSKNKMEVMDANIKLLQGQLELAASEKLEMEKKLIDAEVDRDNFSRELDKLKVMYEKKETELKVLRQEIWSVNDRKKDIFAFRALIKRQFGEKLDEFLNETFGNMNGNGVPVNVSEDLIFSHQTESTGSTEVNVEEPKGKESQSMESISGKNAKILTMKLD